MSKFECKKIKVAKNANNNKLKVVEHVKYMRKINKKSNVCVENKTAHNDHPT